MKIIITEEMRYRQRVVEFAIKYNNNAKAAKRYHTSRQQVQRWRKKYDGTVRSLANKSTRPRRHPNQHTKEELALIKRKHSRFKHEGLAEVYVQCMKEGYKRTYDSMNRQIRKLKLRVKRVIKYPKSKWKPDKVSYPGDKVQVDIKYVPLECIGFDSYGIRYYQITAIDELTRKRVMALVDEKNVNHTSAFLHTLEEKMGFEITTIQTDNGREFVNDPDVTDKLSLFEKTLIELDIKYKRTRPYSPWQNGKVERSHRLDNDMFYSRRRFNSYDQMLKSFNRYVSRYNNIARKVLKFKSPNQMLENFDWSKAEAAV